MRYPKFIKEGSTIAFVAPSFGCAIEPYKSAFQNALRKFDAMGYKTLLGPNCYKSDGIGISTDPAGCGDEFNKMYTGAFGKCDAIISCGGGELMCETLDHIDLEQIAASTPKWYVGFSDNTNFLFNQAVNCDIAGIYGPCAAAYGMEPWHRNLHDVFDLMSGRKLSVCSYGKWESEALKSEEEPLLPYNCTEDTVLKFCPEGAGELRFSGRLLGGCLDVLVTMCGTGYDRVREFNRRYERDGVVWFLESCDLNVFSMRRAMWQLDHCGWFENVKGFIIGRPMHFNEPMMGLDQYEAITAVAAKYNVPIIMDADIGHVPPMMPLIMGSFAEVHAADNMLRVDMKLV